MKINKLKAQKRWKKLLAEIEKIIKMLDSVDTADSIKTVDSINTIYPTTFMTIYPTTFMHPSRLAELATLRAIMK